MSLVKKEEAPSDVAVAPSGRVVTSAYQFCTTGVDSAGGDFFRDAFLARLRDVVHRLNGPRSYLVQRFPDTCARAEFAKALLQFFPKQPTLRYTTQISSVTTVGAEFILHLSDQGWTPSCSTKPAPKHSVIDKIFDEILTDTYLTQRAPPSFMGTSFGHGIGHL